MIVETNRVAGFTPRECEIVQLTAEGLSAKEVGRHLDIAPRTVEKHIDHIRIKMRAKNRPHMVAMAVASGLVQLRAA